MLVTYEAYYLQEMIELRNTTLRNLFAGGDL
jgi:hypothetical protein